MTPLFTEKLDSLPNTVAKLAMTETVSLESAIMSGRSRQAFAVGSGGSAIAAEFFSHCRETLFHASTSVQTPMAFAFGSADISDRDVWFFSAGANNPDIIAGVQAASSRRAKSLHIVTRNPDGVAARKVQENYGRVHTVPVAEAKDGYLATHSLVATIGSLLLACDRASEDHSGTDLLERFDTGVKEALSHSGREQYRSLLEALQIQDTLLLLADPRLRTISVLLETSLWEASLCPVQVTDFRNFAHGRHGWLHHKGDKTFLLALTGDDSDAIWNSIETALPLEVRRTMLNFGSCGRFANALGVVQGLVLVEALGNILDVDPGKPGVGNFGRSIYSDDALQKVVASHTSSVRQKRYAMSRKDNPDQPVVNLASIAAERLQELRNTSFGGVVLDYDGTIVSTQNRLSPPSSDIVQELVRLDRSGISLGIATGRGGSVGEELRKVLAPAMYRSILIGYYNGAYLRSLDINIDEERPEPDPAIDEAIDWLNERQYLFLKYKCPKRGLQITLQKSALTNPTGFIDAIRECPPVADYRLRIDQSAHSLDIVVSRASKLNVVQALEEKQNQKAPILRIGDSGASSGNDNAMLSGPHGISVGQVCGTPEGTWSIFGDSIRGPDALLKILKALVPSEGNQIRFDASAILPDKWQ